MPAPIALFVFNRYEHTKKTIKALQKNELANESELHIFSDGPKTKEQEIDILKIRTYLKKINGFKKINIYESRNNNGLANSIISGVTKIINEYGRVVVLEDDLITSPSFLTYINNLLDKYENEKKIFSITGYNHPPSLMKIPEDYICDIYFNPRPSSWGWATWKDRWQNVDWEIKDFEDFKKSKKLQKEFNKTGADLSEMLIAQMERKVDSWAIRWAYHHFKNNTYCIYPTISYIDNIGLDGSGIHCGNDKKNIYKNSLLNKNSDISLPGKIEENKNIINNFKKVYSTNYIKKIIIFLLKDTFLHKLYKKIKNYEREKN